MTDRELMQMALDALEAMQSYARAEKKGLRICDESIEALRERLLLPDLNSTIEIAEVMEKIGWLKKKEWVGLTEEEAWGMLGQMSLGASVEDVRFVEAKLKEKNI
jgi:hypothetical protein